MKIEKYYKGNDDFGLVMEYCGMEYCEAQFVMPMHRREVFLLHYIFKGQGVFACGQQQHPVRQGDLFAIFPQVFNSYRAHPEDPFHFCWVGFSGTNAPRMMERLGLTPEQPVCSLPVGVPVVELVGRCISLCDSPLPQDEVQMQAELYGLFAGIEGGRGALARTGGAGGVSRAAHDHVHRAKSYIQFNYMVPITIQEVAQQVNLERTYFSKIFHQVEGVAPQEYLLNYRVDSAKRLLADTDYNVREVGALVGIPDAYYFSRIFKRRIGLSPAQYRRSRGNA